MFKLPKFRLYGEKETKIEEAIQPKLELRSWAELEPAEKEIARHLNKLEESALRLREKIRNGEEIEEL